VGTDSTVNASGGTYVAYLYAHDTSSTGIIQCGSFTTDGSGNFNVNLGWEPQYVMIKHSNTVSSNVQDNWIIYDTMRGFVTQSGNGERLYPNLSNAAANGNDMGPTATGFESKGNMLASQTFIYMAIRRPNKPPTSGTQVFSPIALTTTLGTTFTTGFATDFFFESFRTAGWDQRTRSRLTGTPLLLTNTTVGAADDGGNVKWDNNTVTLGTASGYPMVFECFKRAPGFFDVVCYTGTGVARTVAHNLGVVPELMIVKMRSSSGDWFVYHTGLGLNYMWLNYADGVIVDSSRWNATYPTSSAFSIGTHPFINVSSGNYVAYLFATLAGISKVGSYTGNGGTQNIECGFAAGARFVLIKRKDSTGDWYVWDTARGIVTGNDPHLSLNTTAAEVTTDDSIDPYSPGFTVNQLAATDINVTSATYIFLAIA
jgi:hypothetical protein